MTWKPYYKDYLTILGLVAALLAAFHWAWNIDQTIPAWLDEFITWLADLVLYVPAGGRQ